MKKLLLTLITACLLPLSAFAANFEEGKHYEVLPNAATTKPQVQEFFSYFCSHCYNFEPLVKQLKGKLIDGVKFEKMHVNFLPPRQPEQALLLSKALASAQLLKVEPQINSQIFEAIHVKKERNITESAIKGMFASAGIDEKTFEGTFNSFMVNGATSQMANQQAKMNIRGVPKIIVNGKYQVLGGVKTEEEYIELVNFLTTLK